MRLEIVDPTRVSVAPNGEFAQEISDGEVAVWRALVANLEHPIEPAAHDLRVIGVTAAKQDQCQRRIIDIASSDIQITASGIADIVANGLILRIDARRQIDEPAATCFVRFHQRRTQGADIAECKATAIAGIEIGQIGEGIDGEVITLLVRAQIAGCGARHTAGVAGQARGQRVRVARIARVQCGAAE